MNNTFDYNRLLLACENYRKYWGDIIKPEFIKDNVYLLSIENKEYTVSFNNGNMSFNDSQHMNNKIYSILDTIKKDVSYDNNPNDVWYLKGIGFYSSLPNDREPFWNENKGENIKIPDSDNPSVKQRVFFDMDGVLAEWRTDVTMEEVFTPGYFRALAPNQAIIDTAYDLYKKGYEVNVLSKACYHAISEKFDWIDEYMPWLDKNNIILVPLEASKEKFISNFKASDVLVDDYEKNFHIIDENGNMHQVYNGICIKCVSQINSPSKYYANIDIRNSVEDNVNIIEDTISFYHTVSKEDEEIERD